MDTVHDHASHERLLASYYLRNLFPRGFVRRRCAAAHKLVDMFLCKLRKVLIRINMRQRRSNLDTSLPHSDIYHTQRSTVRIYGTTASPLRAPSLVEVVPQPGELLEGRLDACVLLGPLARQVDREVRVEQPQQQKKKMILLSC